MLQRCVLNGCELSQNTLVYLRRRVPKTPARTLPIISFLLLLIGACVYTRLLLYATPLPEAHVDTTILATKTKIPVVPRKRVEFPLACRPANSTKSCPVNYYPSNFRRESDDRGNSSSCPDYFRWIYEDLRPWKERGITRETVERARRTASFRLVIIEGRAYVERYQKAFQSRDVFTLWGILQLLRRYPGEVPDLELMFDCVDWPVVHRQRRDPPAVFRYCGDDATLDIVFPDWSFWGWPEINIKPWGELLEEIREGNRKKGWMEREPFAFWKGNPMVAPTRQELLKCNVSEGRDWGARIFSQDWIREFQQGYQQSDLSNQCTHRYKIYIEGSAWSVSEKYILACDSTTLIVKPRYYDFFSRSLMPVHHYWPIRDDDKCRSIKFAVDWGNSHKSKAQSIGREASRFIQEEVKMEFVYDYMFHLLTEYSKLLRFMPVVPPNASELCSEVMACPAEGLEKKFQMGSLQKGPAVRGPCLMPPPYEPPTLGNFLNRKSNSIKQVEIWESKFWGSRM